MEVGHLPCRNEASLKKMLTIVTPLLSLNDFLYLNMSYGVGGGLMGGCRQTPVDYPSFSFFRPAYVKKHLQVDTLERDRCLTSTC